MSALPIPIAPTGPAPQAWSVVHRVIDRIRMAREIQAAVAQFAKGDASAEEDVRVWAGRIEVLEKRLARAKTSARLVAGGGT